MAEIKYLKFIASFLISLVLTLPFYTSTAYASLDVTVKDSFGAEDFVREEDFLPENEITVDIAPLGGALLNEETGYWTVSQADLNSGNNVEFYLIRAPTPTCVDEATGEDDRCMINQAGQWDQSCLTSEVKCTSCISIDEMNKAEEYSRRFRSYIEPKFS